MPNIKGRIGWFDDSQTWMTAGDNNRSQSGPFYYDGTGNGGDLAGSSGTNGRVIWMDASRLYNGTKYRNNCNDISVNSYVVYIWIRTA